MNARPNHRKARGLGAIAAILVLVVLATIAAAVVRLAGSEQTGFTQQLLAARALQAANAGVEWGLYQALHNSSCTSGQFDLSDLGMHVNVSCATSTYNEGQSSESAAQTLRVYTVDATACNSTACPDASRAVGPGYVERRRQVQATDH